MTEMPPPITATILLGLPCLLLLAWAAVLIAGWWWRESYRAALIRGCRSLRRQRRSTPPPRRRGTVPGTTPLRGSRPQDVTVSLTDVALAMFPELQRKIADLRDAGWSFVLVTDDGGELVELRGVRAWPGDYADALMVRYTTDAAGLCRPHGKTDPKGDRDDSSSWGAPGGGGRAIDGHSYGDIEGRRRSDADWLALRCRLADFTRVRRDEANVQAEHRSAARKST
jgi:hypothetical protein